MGLGLPNGFFFECHPENGSLGCAAGSICVVEVSQVDRIPVVFVDPKLELENIGFEDASAVRSTGLGVRVIVVPIMLIRT